MGTGVGGERAHAAVGGGAAKPAVVFRPAQRADLAAVRNYVGQVEALQQVDIIARVAGEIGQVHFVEGSIVKEGDVLFTIDPSQYRATVALCQADVSSARANLDYAQRYFKRLNASDKRSVSATDLDAAESNVAKAKAAVDQAIAALRLAEIDLEHCTIKSPITGQIGRAAFTRGNYVTPASGPLARIAQVDPIRVKFNMPDRDYLADIESLKASDGDVFETHITLPDGKLYPFNGARDFEDNTMDSSTGTMTMRVRFSNMHRTLVPGTVVRVHVKPLTSRVSMVVPSAAIIGSAQGDVVYIVGNDDRIEARPVELGEEFATMTEVRSGLIEGERVVVRGIQNVRPGMDVEPTPERSEGEGPTPADIARESGGDLKIIPVEAIK